MRRPIQLAKDRVVCKSCSLRLAHLVRNMGQMDAKFLHYFVNRFINEILGGVLSVNYVTVSNGIWEYVPRADVVKKATEAKKEPKKHDPTDREAPDYNPWQDPTRDYEVDEKIENGFLTPEGRYHQGYPPELVGKLYRDVNPRRVFPK